MVSSRVGAEGSLALATALAGGTSLVRAAAGRVGRGLGVVVAACGVRMGESELPLTLRASKGALRSSALGALLHPQVRLGLGSVALTT